MTLPPDHYISTKEAAAIYEYHPSYVARLCKSGKVDGILMGGSWVVNRDSLEAFIQGRAKEKRAHAEALSIERKQEYQQEVSGALVAPSTPPLSSHLMKRAPRVAVFALFLFAVIAYGYSTQPVVPQSAQLSAAAATTERSVLNTVALETYYFIESFFDRSTRVFANLFTSDAPTFVYLPATSTPTSSGSSVAITNAPVSENYVTQNYYPVEYRFFGTGGVSIEYVQRSLQVMHDSLVDVIQDNDSDNGSGGGGLADISGESIENLVDVAAMTKAFGDLLLWNGSEWTNVATSSLGINAGSGAPGGASGQVQFNNAGLFTGDAAFTFSSAFGRLSVNYASTTGITSNYASSTSLYAGDFHIAGPFFDASNLSGTNGYVLQTTGSGVTWVATSTLGLGGGGAGSVTSVDASGGTTGLAFSGGPITGSGTLTLSGILNPANGGTGWSTIAAGTVLLGNGTGALSTTTRGNISGTGINVTGGTNAILGGGVSLTLDTTGDWTGTFDGAEGSYYLANSFSSTSAAYYLSQNVPASFSTTSADYWKSVRDFFSTTSAQYFAHTSTTIPKTYTSNTFTGGQTFTGGVTIGSLSGILKATAGVVSAATAGTDFENPLSFVYPLVRSVNSISLAFGTTTANSWSAQQTFTGLFATNASSTNATTTSLGINSETFTDLTGTGLQNVGGALTLNATGDWTGTFDGQEGSYYVANSFSSTSAAYYLSQNQGGAFSTTSAQYFVHSSTTIPKTYTANTFTGAQVFSGGVTIGSLNGLLKGTNGLVSAAVAGTDYVAGGAGAATTTLSTSGALSFSANPVVFGSSPISLSLGTVGVSNGGTGWTTIQANSILLGNGSGALATTSAGTNGQVLALVSGVPTWVATTSINNGVSSLTGTANQIAVSAATGAITLSIPSQFSIQNASTTNFSANTLAVGGIGTTTIGTNGALITPLLTIGSLSGILKATAGLVSAATAGTDFENPLTFVYPLVRAANSVSLAFGTTTNNTWSGTNTFQATTTHTYITNGAGSVGAPSYTFSGDLNTGLYQITGGRVGLAVGGVQALDIRSGAFEVTSGITASRFNQGVTIGTSYSNTTPPSQGLIVQGNLGIGTTSPSQVLSVQGNGLFSGNLSTANLNATGTITTALGTGLVKSTAGVLGLATAGTDYVAGGAGAATTTLSTSGALSFSANPVVFGASPITLTLGTIGYANGGTGTTTAPQGQLIYGGATAYQSVATSSLAVGNGLTTTSGSLGYQVGGTNASIGLAAIAANTILANGTGASAVPTALATSSLFAATNGQVLARVNGTWIGVATTTAGTGLTYTGTAFNVNASQNITTLSNLTTDGIVYTSGGNGTLNIDAGALDVARGGTGWANVQANALLFGNGSGALATTSAGTNGQVLALVNGVPTWVATTSVNNGVSSIQQTGGGAAQTGAITFATSSQTTNGQTIGLNITNSGSAFTFAPTLSGTLSVAGGGTGQTSFTAGNLVYGAGNGALQNVATSAPALSSSFSYSGTLGSFVGGAAGTLSIATGGVTNAMLQNSTISGIALGSNLGDLTASNSTLTFSGTYNGSAARSIGLNLGNANTWTALQQFNGNASSTQLSANVAYFGGTATSTFTSAGFLGIGSTSPWAKLSINPVAGDGAAPAFAIGSTTATNFVVTNAGNVGIGTTSPGALLGVNGSILMPVIDSGGLKIGSVARLGVDNGTETTFAYGGASGFRLLDTANARVPFKVELGALSSSLYINSSGNVGIGTSTPTNKLTVTGDVNPLNNHDTNGQLAIRGATSPLKVLMLGVDTNAATNYGYIQSGEDNTATRALVFNPIGGNVGVATTSPYATLSVHANNGVTNQTLFAIGSSTAAATSTLFSVSNTGSTTAANGFNITAGCYAVNGTCIGGSSFSNTLANGGTATTTFYAGGVVYSDGTKLTQATGAGNSIFAFDNTNGRLGLGTSTPWAQLSINPNGITGPSFVIGSSTATQFIINNAGNVGIGTTSPGAKLAVNGNLLLEGVGNYVNFATTSGTNGYGFRDNGGVMEFKNMGGSWQGVTTATTGPSFSVNKGGSNQTVVAATPTVITWGNEVFDTNNNFASNRFTPTVPGKYLFTAALECFAQAANGSSYCYVYIYKNGSQVASQYALSATNGDDINPAVTILLNMNGTTDYVEAWGTSGTGTTFAGTNNSYTHFEGVMIAPVNGNNVAGWANDGISSYLLDNADFVGIGTSTPWAKLAVNPLAGDANQFVIGSSTGTSFIVNNAGRVGIGTTTPWARLSLDTSNLAAGVPSFSVGSSTRQDLVVLQNGNVGIGTTVPGAKLHVNGTIYVDTLSNNTNMAIGPANVNDDVNFSVNGSSAYFTFMGGGSGGGNLGIGTTTPWGLLSVNANALIAGTPQFVVGSSTATNLIVANNGFVGIGTTSPSQALSVNGNILTSGNMILGNGTGKLTIGTLDPVYTIDGVSYSTYGTGMIGVKEEVVGTATIDSPVEAPDGTRGYASVIDFDELEVGSDLWLFAQASHIRKNIDRLVVLLTAEGGQDVWYRVDKANRTVYLLSDTPTNVSYRLTAPRFDTDTWTNFNNDNVTGFTPPSGDLTEYFASSTLAFGFDPERLLKGTTTLSMLVDNDNASTTDIFAPWNGGMGGVSEALKEAMEVLEGATINAMEGVQYIADGVFKRIFAGEVHTDTICVSKSDGTEVCITGDQLADMMAGAAAAQNGGNGGSNTGGGNTGGGTGGGDTGGGTGDDGSGGDTGDTGDTGGDAGGDIGGGTEGDGGNTGGDTAGGDGGSSGGDAASGGDTGGDTGGDAASGGDSGGGAASGGDTGGGDGGGA